MKLDSRIKFIIKWGLAIFLILFLILVVLFILTNQVLFSRCSPIQLFEDQNKCKVLSDYNESISNLYITKFYPEGKKIVDSKVENIRNLPTDEEKIDAIVLWMYTDKKWINPQWSTTKNCPCTPFDDDLYCSYEICDGDPTRFKAVPGASNYANPQKNPGGIYYFTDPYWIAYNKVGTCTEFATLFSHMANNVGIESSIIESNSIFLDGHRWAEVKINDQIMYVDPWCAGEKNSTHEFSIADKWRWYNKTENFRTNCYIFAGIIPTFQPNNLTYFDYFKTDISPMFRYGLSSLL